MVMEVTMRTMDLTGGFKIEKVGGEVVDTPDEQR